MEYMEARMQDRYEAHGNATRPIVAEQQGGVHQDIIKRYDDMLSAFTHRVECQPEPGTEPCHLRWMLRQIGAFSDAGKGVAA